MHLLKNKNRFAIGICTRNRWEMLEKVLVKIADFGWSEVSVYIVDDASDEPCGFDPRRYCANATLVRNPRQEGYIVNRNRIALAIKEPYYLSLDDDSYPLHGSVDDCLNFMDSRKDAFCSSFPIFNVLSQKWQNPSFSSEAYPTRSFIGCGHMINLRIFKDVGLYQEELVHQGEEVDVAYRSWLKGYKTFHFPGLQIEHAETSSGRSRPRMDYYGARNKFIWNKLYTGNASGYLNLRAFAERIVLAGTSRSLFHLKGAVDGLLFDVSGWPRPYNLVALKEWRKLPIA